MNFQEKPFLIFVRIMKIVDVVSSFDYCIDKLLDTADAMSAMREEDEL
jgi:hypothetical protein